LPANGSTELTLGKAKVAALPMAATQGKPIVLGVRAEDLVPCEADEAWFTGELALVERLGGQTFGYLGTGGERLITVEFPRASPVKVGDIVSVKGEAAVLHLFDGESGKRLN
jgi:alpha-glucoside transport system ATP-binding protein